MHYHRQAQLRSNKTGSDRQRIGKQELTADVTGGELEVRTVSLRYTRQDTEPVSTTLALLGPLPSSGVTNYTQKRSCVVNIQRVGQNGGNIFETR